VLFSYGYNIETCKIIGATYIRLHFWPCEIFRSSRGQHGPSVPMANTPLAISNWKVNVRSMICNRIFVDPEIIGFQWIIKIEKKTATKYIARRPGMTGGLKKLNGVHTFFFYFHCFF